MLYIELKIRDDGTDKDRCVLIGENVIVRLEAVTNNKVRLSFDAPRSVPIVRAEAATPEYLEAVLSAARAK